jgi:hypothetical protein
MHNFLIKPTADNLANFALWLCASEPQVSPSRASGYLSGVCSVLELFSPKIHTAQNSTLVLKTLAGLCKRFATLVSRKRVMETRDVSYVYNLLHLSESLDDSLFASIIAVGFFHALHCLGEFQFATKLFK